MTEFDLFSWCSQDQERKNPTMVFSKGSDKGTIIIDEGIVLQTNIESTTFLERVLSSEKARDPTSKCSPAGGYQGYGE